MSNLCHFDVIPEQSANWNKDKVATPIVSSLVAKCGYLCHMTKIVAKFCL